MASANRSMLSAGAFLSAAAIAVATPAVVPGHLAGVPAPLSLSQAHFELTALADITLQGAVEAFASGWGGFIGPEDLYYPGTFNNDVSLDGFSGVAYYLADQALDGIVPFNLENYFFEVGSQTPADFVNAGLGAAAYVGASEIFGIGSLPAQLVQAVLGGGLAVDIGEAVVAATAGLPVIGDLTSVYFTGQVAGDATLYGVGVLGVLSYAVQTLLPGVIGGGVGNNCGSCWAFSAAAVPLAASVTAAPVTAVAEAAAPAESPVVQSPAQTRSEAPVATTAEVAEVAGASESAGVSRAEAADTTAASGSTAAAAKRSAQVRAEAPAGEKAAASTRGTKRAAR